MTCLLTFSETAEAMEVHFSLKKGRRKKKVSFSVDGKLNVNVKAVFFRGHHFNAKHSMYMTLHIVITSSQVPLENSITSSFHYLYNKFSVVVSEP